jgi:thiamine biosynthesis lipoprotein ApbE/Na+-translocating ferredoxin:NAD+ oxidoreductase RnfG subunit
MEAFKKPWVAALLRALLVVLAAAGVRQSLRWTEAQRGRAVTLAEARMVFPDAGSVGLREPGPGMQEVRDDGGGILGKVLLTQPDQRDVKGYAGPTQVVAGIRPDGSLAAWEILSSADTGEHVSQVRADAAFRGHLHGWKRGAAAPDLAVAGSTLTSRAVRESLLRRLGGVAAGESVRFAEPVSLADVRTLFPAAESMVAEGGGWRVLGGAGAVLGQVLRSAPWADAVRGYQGASEVLIGLDAAGEKLLDVKLRRSEDNEPYVGYVREDEGWLGVFRGKTVREVAAMDFAKAGVEGVSGATLTSFAVAESVRVRCAEAGRAAGAVPSPESGGAWWRAADVVLALIALGGVGMAFSGWRGRKWLRRGWQLLLVLVPGVWLGSLLALPLLEGWVVHGVGWRVMPGMVLLAAVALLMPVATGRQVYCHQICPHGALQEWLGGWLRPRPLPARWDRWLRLVPGALLVGAFVSVALSWGWPLADFEAFDAWVPRAAGMASWLLAVLGLGAALVIPQAYCRYGCPTGALLRFLRRSGGRSPGWAEAVAVACVLLAWFPWLRLQARWDQTPAAASPGNRISGTALGTSWSLQLREPLPDGLRETLETQLARIDAGISAWRADSVVSACNAAAAGRNFPVPLWVAELTGEARRLSEATGGAFDATVGPLVAAWGFGAAAREGREPAEAELARLRNRCGWWKVQAGPGWLRRDDPAVQLDLTPLGEGAALDAMASVLEKSVNNPWLLSLGGELRARGRWTVRLESAGCDLVLADESVSTSGTNRARQGSRSHLIDARNGRPVVHDTVSVSVRHASAAQADGWATALAVLGAADGKPLADRMGLAALFVRETPRGRKVEASAAWHDPPQLTRNAP